jgi:cytidylate kinase
MPVITISRELGSHGDDVARAVAERLGLRLIGRELINRAARAAGAPEVALAEIDELGLLGVRPRRNVLRLYREKAIEVIRELAAGDDILLVGRGGQSALAGRPGVLHVRIIAPTEARVRQVAENAGINLDTAAARVAASDRSRADFLRRCYGVPVDDPALYDLVLNLAHLGPDAAVEIICCAAKAMRRA